MMVHLTEHACFHFFFLLRSPPDPFLFPTVVNAIMELTM